MVSCVDQFMRTARLAVLVLVGCVVMPASVRADEDAGAPKLSDAEYCKRTRTPRVQAVQIRTKQWLDRLAKMRAACTVSWVKTGAVRLEGNRAVSEQRAEVKCPNGPPQGETKESVWAALSLFLDDAPLTDEVVTTQNADIDAMNVRCEAEDTKAAIPIRPLVNDMPALKRIVAWTPPK